MDYFPALSPSSFSDETLVGTPDLSLSSSPSTKNLFDEFSAKLQLISKEENVSSSLGDPLVLLQEKKRLRRNAISFQSSNDDTIVSHGPSFGVVFGNVSGGKGSLEFRKLKSCTSQPSTPSSIAFYLSPTYGLPGLPFDFLPESTTVNGENIPEDVRSAFSSDESSSNEEEGEEGKSCEKGAYKLSSQQQVWRRRKVYTTNGLPRSPALKSLSSFLEEAPLPPFRLNDKKASLSAPCRGKHLIRSNRRFFDAIQANTEEIDENFVLQNPPPPVNKPTRPPLSRQRSRQTSQRISLKEVSIQAQTSE